jgi:hypothetical protein
MLSNTAFLKCNYTRSVVNTVTETEDREQTYRHEPLEVAIIAPIPSTTEHDGAFDRRALER